MVESRRGATARLAYAGGFSSFRPLRLLVPGSRGERRGHGLGDRGIGADFVDGGRNGALPGVEVGDQGSALAHHDPALVSGEAGGSAITLTTERHRLIADWQRLP